MSNSDSKKISFKQLWNIWFLKGQTQQHSSTDISKDEKIASWTNTFPESYLPFQITSAGKFRLFLFSQKRSAAVAHRLTIILIKTCLPWRSEETH